MACRARGLVSPVDLPNNMPYIAKYMRCLPVLLSWYEAQDAHHEAHVGGLSPTLQETFCIIPNFTGNFLHYPELYRKLSALSLSL